MVPHPPARFAKYVCIGKRHSRKLPQGDLSSVRRAGWHGGDGRVGPSLVAYAWQRDADASAAGRIGLGEVRCASRRSADEERTVSGHPRRPQSPTPGVVSCQHARDALGRSSCRGGGAGTRRIRPAWRPASTSIWATPTAIRTAIRYPTADGKMRTREGAPLANCPVNTRFELLRVPDRSPEFLRYLREGGLIVGAAGQLTENQPSAGIVTVRMGERSISLSREMAARILVRPLARGMH